MRYLLTALILALSLPAFGATQTRTSAFAYDASTGLLIQEVIEPDNAALRLQTDYLYDNFGNKVSVTVSGADIVTRTSTTTYDTRGQFPVSSANALGHTETRVFDARFGTVTSLTGPNALTTTWQYDGFGRKVLETRADTTSTTVAYNATDANCSSVAYAYAVTTTSTGAPNSGACYDLLNREIRSYAQGFDSTIVYKDTQYNSLGQVAQVSRPYYAGAAHASTSYTYDSIGRIIEADERDATSTIISVTKTEYDGLTTRFYDANNHKTIRLKNSQGQLIQVTDAKLFNTYYSYDPFGNLTQTTDAKNNLTTLAYDIRGRKISMSDPDMGTWSYQYNVLGELIKQTDAKLQVTTLTYDKLGRMLSRSEPDLASAWTYDTAAKGIGKPAKASSTNGYARTYAYDTLGRISSVVSAIDATYTVSTTYDSVGRVATYTYPTGFAVKNVYNAQGYLAEVRSNASNALYWKANSKDAEGHLLNQTLGNALTTSQIFDPNTGRLQNILTGTSGAVQSLAYTFDTVGNLLARTDNTQSLIEGFTYDELNRLLAYSKNAATAQTYTYDEIGNLASKSDMGAYAYNTNGVRPHAVANVTGPTATLNYTYDANGNLLTGAGRTVTWNSFNMPYQVTQGSSTLTYVYDPDHVRLREIGPNGTTIYLNPRLDMGGHFEKVINTNGVTEYKHYIYAGSIPVAVSTARSNGVNDTRFFHTDHLGSIAVVTNETGAVVARFSYDPFGNRTTVSGDATVTHHGFTGHELMEEVGLINMNGRIYDPALARFMSADPNIQAPGNGQNFNRYSYVFNNPLSYTDPTGYWSLIGSLQSAWKSVWNSTVGRTAVIIAVAYFTGNWAASSYENYAANTLLNGGTPWAIGGSISTTSGIIGGTAGGFSAGFVGSNGDLQTGIKGGISGGVFGGINGYYGDTWNAERVAVNSAASGTLARANGGTFREGVLNALRSALAVQGFNYASDATNALKFKSCDLGNSVCVRNRWGELLTDGWRNKECVGECWGENWLTSAGMGKEGAGLYDPVTNTEGHYYSENGSLGRFINQVSKVHDFFNSVGYNGNTGAWISRGEVYDSLFQVYSFAGMGPAALLTGYATVVSENPMLLRNSR